MKHWLAAAGGVALACGGALLACSSDPAVPEKVSECTGADCAEDSGTPDAARPACEAEATAYCQTYERCYPAEFVVYWTNLEECAKRRAISCKVRLGAPGSGETESRLEACARDRETFECEKVESGLRPPSCATPSGERADGESCVDSAQCKSAYCRTLSVELGTACGICGKLGKVGDSCQNWEECEPPLGCGAGTCGPLAKAGESCASTLDCEARLSCVDSRCAPPLSVGDACGPSTASCALSERAYCDEGTKVCALSGLANAGQACKLGNRNLTRCAAGGYCRTEADAGGSGACIAPAEDGAPCDGERGPRCRAPALCHLGVCTLPRASACD